MKIIDFLQLHGIRWQPISLRPGTKSPCVVRSTAGLGSRIQWQPKTNDYYGLTRLSDDQLLYRQVNHPKPYSHIVIDTTDIQQVDVDAHDAIPNLDVVVEQLGPWYKSCTKQLPHVFVRLVNKEKYGKRDVSVLSDKIDILNGQWSLALTDSEVYGHENDIEPLCDSFLKSCGTKRKNREPSSPDLPRVLDDDVADDDDAHLADGSDDGTDDLDDIDRLLGMLSVTRLDTYQSWLDVGIVLRSVGGVDKYLDKWLACSARSDKFDHDACVAKWHTIRRSDVSLGSLRFWAKQDNPVRFQAWVNDDVARSVTTMQNFEDYNIAADLVHKMFKDTFVAAPVAGGRFEWYEFRGHRFHCLMHSPHTLLISFSEAVARVFNGERDRCEDEANNTDVVEDKKYFTERGKECMKVAKRMCNNAHKAAILRECSLLFRCDNFETRLNEYKHLIGFDNGVFDLELMLFRPGKPEDYITYTTRYDYVADVDPVIRADIMKFKRSIMPNDRMTDYLICTEAYALDGDTWIQNINIQTGYGGNGKGINAVLNAMVFGDYFYAPDISLFTKPKSSSSGTSSELAKARGRRYLLSTEPEAHEKLQVSKIKYLSGGDPVQARPLYKDPIEFVPQFAITLQMNQIPRLSNHDGGIGRRLKFIPFIYNFVTSPKSLNEKKLDVTLRKRFDTKAYAQQNVLILLEYYAKYLKGHQALTYPPEVLAFTEQYMEEENVVQMFVQVCCQVTHDPKHNSQSSVLYNNFKHSEYFREEVSSVIFARKMQEIGIKKKKIKGAMQWIGIVFVLPDNEYES